MTYPSRVDSWVAIVLALVPVSLAFETIYLRSVLVGVAAISIPVLYVLVVFPMKYEIGPDALTIRSGILRTSIPYREIRQVRPSRSWLSAPALSLDRLEITYNNSRMTLISPRDRPAFLRELAAHVPVLRIDS